MQRQWPSVLDALRAINPMLGAVVGDARPVELAASTSCSPSARTPRSCARRPRSAASRAALAEALRSVTGHALTPSYELRAGEAPAAPPPLSEDELVARLLDEFDAEVLANTDEEGR